jgi:hypothetical protein
MPAVQPLEQTRRVGQRDDANVPTCRISSFSDPPDGPMALSNTEHLKERFRPT